MNYLGFSPLIDKLITALRCLPGVGPKSAQRMAFYLLERNRDGGCNLASVLQEAITKVRYCERCRILSEVSLCNICANPKRDQHLLCVVESPSDVVAIEKAGGYHGLYFVLRGHLSPIDSIGPEEIGANMFHDRLLQGEIREVIMATNPTVEGEATAYYLSEITKSHSILTTRIAHGVPFGGELELLDGNTVSKALVQRAPISA